MSARVVVMLAVAAAGLAACGGGDGETTSSPTASATATSDADVVIEVADFSFTPADATIAVGDTIEWRWTDTSQAHNVVADDQTFSSGSVTADPTTVFSHTFTDAGTISYMCQAHSAEMKGTITVE